VIRATHSLPLKHILEPIHQGKTDKPRNPTFSMSRVRGGSQMHALESGLGLLASKKQNLKIFEGCGAGSSRVLPAIRAVLW